MEALREGVCRLPGFTEPTKETQEVYKARMTQLIWDHYLATWPRKATLTPKRRIKILARILDSTTEDILGAISGSKRDPWAERPLHSDLETILRSREQIERFLRMPVTGAKDMVNPSWDATP